MEKLWIGLYSKYTLTCVWYRVSFKGQIDMLKNIRIWLDSLQKNIY